MKSKIVKQFAPLTERKTFKILQRMIARQLRVRGEIFTVNRKEMAAARAELVCALHDWEAALAEEPGTMGLVPGHSEALAIER